MEKCKEVHGPAVLPPSTVHPPQPFFGREINTMYSDILLTLKYKL
jgi:hypothetical protein